MCARAYRKVLVNALALLFAQSSFIGNILEWVPLQGSLWAPPASIKVYSPSS